MSIQIKQSKPFLGALLIAGLSIGISNYIISLFAVDIALTFFGSSDAVAIASVTQLTTFNSAIEILFAFVMTYLAICFRHKRLLLFGSSLVLISAIGSVFAPNLLSLQFFYTLEGVGSIIASIMVYTIIGDYLPPEKKAKAIGYLNAVGACGSLIVILLITFVSSIQGWRFSFMIVAAPLSLIACILTIVLIPSIERKENQTKSNSYVTSLKQIFKNKSARACLLASIFTVAGSQVAIFATAFYRTRFGLSKEWTGLIFEIAIIMFIVAPLTAGWLVNKFGAKRMSIISALLAALFVSLFFFVPNVWGAVFLDMAHVWFAATSIVSFASLIIDQIPDLRGTLLSLNSLSNNLGTAIATASGGILLVLTNGMYASIGLAFGIATVIGVVIIAFFAVDINKKKVAQKNGLEEPNCQIQPAKIN
jgi:predicted MFS family arabinose efflux permease